MHEWSTLMRIMCIEKWAWCMRMRWCKCLITLLDVWGCLGVVSHKLLCSAFLSDTLFYLKKDMTWHFNPLSENINLHWKPQCTFNPFQISIAYIHFLQKRIGSHSLLSHPSLHDPTIDETSTLTMGLLAYHGNIPEPWKEFRVSVNP